MRRQFPADAARGWRGRACFSHRDDVLLRLRAQHAVVLVRYGLQQRANTRGVIIQAKVSGGEHRHHLTTTFVKVGEDADQVARFLRIGSN